MKSEEISTENKKIIVIGGGPAGMMAAATAAKRGNKVLLIEKNKMLGKKMLITGKGRCNITSACEDVETLIANVPTNSSFLYSAFYTFTNYDTIELFNSLGVETKVERGERVFPVSDKSIDVVSAMERYIKQCGVQIVNDSAEEIIERGGKIQGVRLLKGGIMTCDSVILATGGLSYQRTGSTGDGYWWAEDLGHTIIEPKPSLVPLTVEEEWTSELMGLSLKNIEINVLNAKGKKIYTDFGEMMFAHFGISGPVILSASAHLRNMDNEKYTIVVDLKPALNEKQLDERIQRDFQKYINKNFRNCLKDLLPGRLIDVIVKLSGISPLKKVNSITRDERMRLVKLLKGLKLTVKDFCPIEQAIITSGGVCVKEIDPSTMQSKIVEGLYFAGEIIDVDAYTGGFNLQIAFSTGYLAGMSC